MSPDSRNRRAEFQKWRRIAENSLLVACGGPGAAAAGNALLAGVDGAARPEPEAPLGSDPGDRRVHGRHDQHAASAGAAQDAPAAEGLLHVIR